MADDLDAITDVYAERDDQAAKSPVVEDDRPVWLPQKFAAPEALAQSYGELEKAFHAKSQEHAAMERNFAALAEQLEEIQSVPAEAPEAPQMTPGALAAIASLVQQLPHQLARGDDPGRE